jgi:peroxiredoxin
MRTGHRVAMTTTVALALVATASALGIGDAAPARDVMMRDVAGADVSIASVNGDNGTLVIFSCNACPWAKAWEERIAEIGNAYRDRGVGVIMINSNDPERVPEDGFDEMQRRAAARDLRFPYVVDATSDVARAFGATRTPEAFLFDRNGRLVYHGTIDDNAQSPERVSKRYLKDALDAVLAGSAVPQPETKALGCTIKFR